MIILSHRGYWREADEKNRPVAFRRSFDLGFGTETDIRDCAGELLVSHDMPLGEELPFDDFLKIYGDSTLPLALNIKSDGLVRPLREKLDAHGVTNSFVFDMSIPDTRAYLAENVPVFVRMSEVERDPAWMDRAKGVWLDAFESEWYGPDMVQELIHRGKSVCLVSPELHGREYLPLWNMVSELKDEQGLMLCTDFPEHAEDFFCS